MFLSFWFPEGASTISADHDWLFNFILLISTIFFFLIVVVGTLFVMKYRRRPGVTAQPSPHHNTTLEIVWSAIPSVLIVFMFGYGFQTYLEAKRVPPEAYEIQVTAQKWSWLFTYPNGAVDSELHVPAGRAIRLVMSSEDVLHSLAVPAFRVKQDVVPGRYTEMWFEAPKPGVHQLYCTEYCGTKHSEMLSKVHVHEQGEFDAWVEDAANLLEGRTPAEAGAMIVEINGCYQCHSIDGSVVVGPSFKNLFGSTRNFADGSSVTADENYIRESILEPGVKIVKGYDPAMPTYKGRLSDEYITAIIAFIKECKD